MWRMYGTRRPAMPLPGCVLQGEFAEADGYTRPHDDLRGVATKPLGVRPMVYASGWTPSPLDQRMPSAKVAIMITAMTALDAASAQLSQSPETLHSKEETRAHPKALLGTSLCLSRISKGGLVLFYTFGPLKLGYMPQLMLRHFTAGLCRTSWHNRRFLGFVQNAKQFRSIAGTCHFIIWPDDCAGR